MERRTTIGVLRGIAPRGQPEVLSPPCAGLVCGLAPTGPPQLRQLSLESPPLSRQPCLPPFCGATVGLHRQDRAVGEAFLDQRTAVVAGRFQIAVPLSCAILVDESTGNRMNNRLIRPMQFPACFLYLGPASSRYKRLPACRSLSSDPPCSYFQPRGNSREPAFTSSDRTPHPEKEISPLC